MTLEGSPVHLGLFDVVLPIHGVCGDGLVELGSHCASEGLHEDKLF